MSTVAGGVFYEQDAANEKDWTGFLQFPNKNWRTFVRQREKLRSEKRAAAEQELGRIENELKQKLLELNTTSAQAPSNPT